MYVYNTEEAKKQWDTLGFDKKRLAEVRCIYVDAEKKCPKEKKVVSRKLIGGLDDYMAWGREFNAYQGVYGSANCYVGLNPRGADWAVSAIGAFGVDIDPFPYDKLVGATDTQTNACVDAGRFILDKFKGGNLVYTGNGAFVFWTCDNGTIVKPEQVAEFQKQCRELIKDREGIRIDATFDAQRLTRKFGPVNTKGRITRPRFLMLPRSRGDGNGVFALVGGLTPQKSKSATELLAQPSSRYASRSEADFALAVFYKKSGLGASDCLEALKRNAFGRQTDEKDQARIIEKVYGGDSAVPGGTLRGSSSISPLTLYSPKDEGAVSDYKSGLGRREEAKGIPPLPSGIRELDQATFGLRRGEILTVAARPGNGKSSLLRSMAYSVCCVGKRVLLLTTEMRYQQVWDAVISANAEIDNKCFMTGTFTEEEAEKRDKFLDEFSKREFVVCDQFKPNLQSVAQAVSQLTPDVVMFDYVQHMAAGNSKVLAIEEFMRGFKELAMEKNFAAVVASQLDRPMKIMDYKTGTVRTSEPTLGDMKWCGAIEEESTMILLLHNTEATLPSGNTLTKAMLKKNRFGPRVDFNLEFNGKYSKFQEIK